MMFDKHSNNLEQIEELPTPEHLDTGIPGALTILATNLPTTTQKSLRYYALQTLLRKSNQPTRYSLRTGFTPPPENVNTPRVDLTSAFANIVTIDIDKNGSLSIHQDIPTVYSLPPEKRSTLQHDLSELNINTDEDTLDEITLDILSALIHSIDGSMANTTFTEREYIAYSLSQTFNSITTIAEIQSNLFNTQQQPGTVQKYIRRAEDKLFHAKQTISAVEILERISLGAASMGSGPIHLPIRTDIERFTRFLSIMNHDYGNACTWNLTDNIDFDLTYLPQANEFRAAFYYDADNLQLPVTVQTSEINHDLVTVTDSPGDTPFESLNDTTKDIKNTVMRKLEKAPYFNFSYPNGDEFTPTDAFNARGYDNGFVVFKCRFTVELTGQHGNKQ